MSNEISGRKRSTIPKKHVRVQKRKRDDVDVDKLSKAVEELVSEIAGCRQKLRRNSFVHAFLRMQARPTARSPNYPSPNPPKLV